MLLGECNGNMVIAPDRQLEVAKDAGASLPHDPGQLPPARTGDTAGHLERIVSVITVAALEPVKDPVEQEG